ncbi:MAG: LptF/LptG family permease [Planctomycetota bacterium]|jgi:lipopolysaccharide export system permease protein
MSARKQRAPGTVLTRRLPLGSRLDRYVASHFVRSYLLAMLLMTGLFMVIDMASNLDDYLETWEDGSSAPGSVLALYYLFNLPYLFLQVAPFITLIAGMFTVAKLLKAREVTAVLGAGISARRMLLPVFLAGLLLAVGMFFLREAVGLGIARDRDAARDVLVEHRFEEHYDDVAVVEDAGSLVFLNEFIPRPADGGPPRVERLTAIRRTSGQMGSGRYVRIDAERATWNGSGWDLEGGVRATIDPDGGGESTDEAVSTLEGYAFTPELALTYRRAKDAPLELTFSEVQALMARDPDDNSYQTLWHYHLTFPLANLLLLLVGIPLMFNYERGRSTDRIAVGGLLCVFYYSADFVFRTLGVKGQLSPLLSAWIPVLVFGSLGIMLYDSLRS